MRPRWRKVRADLVGRPARTLLAVLSLAVGVFAVAAIHFGTDEITGSFDRSFAETNPPSAVMRVEPGFGDQLVTEAAELPEVASAEGRRRVSARARKRGESSSEIELVAFADEGANRIARVDPRSGAWPPGPGQVILERASLDELDVEVGDALEIRVPDAPPVELTVAGSALDFYEIPPSFGGVARGYVDRATVEDLTGSGSLNTLLVRASGDPRDRGSAIAASAAVREEVVEPSGRVVEVSQIGEPSEHQIAEGVAESVTTLRLLSVAIFVLACVLVVNTVAALMAEQRRQLGVMKAVGATSRQIAGLYLGFALALELAALAIAAPIGILAGRAMGSVFGSTLNYDLRPFEIPWSTVAVAVAVAVLVPTAAVGWSVLRASRATVRATITDYGIGGGHGSIPAMSRVGRPTRLALRNALRNRARLVLTLGTIALAGTLFIGVLSVDRGLGKLTDQLMGYRAYDVELTLTDPTPLPEAASVVAARDGVSDVEGWLLRDGFLVRADGTENEDLSLIGAPPGSPYLEPTLRSGRWFDADDEQAVVVNEDLLREEDGVAVGDAIILDVDGRRVEWPIVGEVSTQLVGPIVYVPVDVLAGAVGRSGDTNLLAVGIDDGADADAVSADVEQALLDSGVPIGGVETESSIRSETEGTFLLLIITLLVVTALLLPIAIVAIAGTGMLAVTERTREIGVLRTIGASSRSVRRLLLVEGLAVTMLGALIGVLVSVPAAWVLGRLFGEQFFMTPLEFSYSLPALVVWLAIALVVGILGAMRPARVASRMTIRETLGYE